MRQFLTLIAFLFPVAAFATCDGTDIRPTLAPAVLEEIAEAAASEPYGTGNYWRATRGDQTLTLIGTIHTDSPTLKPVVTAFADDIATSDVMFLEMTAREEALLQNDILTKPDMVLLPDSSLIDLLPPEVWANLKTAAEARGLPGPAAARMQPWYLSLVLALPPCALASGEMPYVLDDWLEETAVAADVPTEALEPYDTLFTLFAQEPLENQIRLLAASVVDDDTSENMLATTLATYLEEAAAELWHLSRIASRDLIAIPEEELDAIYADLTDTLLTARNRDWVTLLTARPEPKITAAFGAAHLFGKDGVLNLLETEGYVIERIAR